MLSGSRSILVFPHGALLLGLLCLLAAAAAPPPVLAISKHRSEAASIPLDREKFSEALQGSWKIEASKLSYDEENQVYEAEGNVRIGSGDKIIHADWALANLKDRTVELRGNVTLQYGIDWMKGEHVKWNLDSETGTFENGIVYFAQNNFFIQGKFVAKTGPEEFEFKNGFVTSCNPADPDWKIQYEHLQVTVDGMAWAKNSSVWARSLPVLYAPILGAPVQKERQSGFLLPWAGYSTLSGAAFEIPYYWAIRPDMDATFYARYMQNRGAMLGTEFRIANRTFGEGVWMFHYLHDNADRDLLAEKGFPFQTEDRYWVRGKHNLDLPSGWELKLDIDYVSDRNFLREFGNGSASFGQAERTFLSRFGRGLLYDDAALVRESAFYVEKRGDSNLFSLDVRYWEQLDRALAETTVQRLPSFSFTQLPTGTGLTPFYYTFDSSAVNYWCQEGDREQRVDLYPRLYYPLHWGNYLDAEPSVGVRSTSYMVDFQNGGTADFIQRSLGDARLEMSSRVNRVFPVDFAGLSAIQHSFRPEAAYEYVAQDTTGQLPHLDRVDQDLSRNGIRYGFTTFLTGKGFTTDPEGNQIPRYSELARLRVFEFFNIEKPPILDPLFLGRELNEGFSPLGVRLDVMPAPYLRLSYDTDVDWADSQGGTSQDLYVTLDSGKGHILRLDYQKRTNVPADEITAELFIKTLPDLYLNTYHDYSLAFDQLFKHGYGVRYIKGCWGVGIAYEREAKDNRVVFSIDLLGLGSLGHFPFSEKPEYREQLPGYQSPETWALRK